VPLLSHLTSSTSTKSDLYQATFLAAAVSEPALHRLLTFLIPILMSRFRCLSRTKASVQVRVFVCEYFVTRYGLTMRSCSPNPQAGGSPLVGCPLLLIQYIRSFHLYRRPFLQPQPEDAPRRGNRTPFPHGC
jgi:hypothetical protein